MPQSSRVVMLLRDSHCVLHLPGLKPSARLGCCLLRPPLWRWRRVEAGDRRRKRLVIDWNNEQGARWLPEPGGEGRGRRSKGDASLGNRQELSYLLRIKQLRLPCVPPASPSLKLGAPVGKAWRDASRTGRGCSGCGYRPRYAGIQAGKYAGEITCLLGGGRGRGRGVRSSGL